MVDGRSNPGAKGPALGFPDRHPGVILVAMAALCALFASGYIAGMASSRIVVPGSWRAEAVGVAAGVALMAVVIIRYRQQKAGRLLVAPPAVLLIGFLATGRQLLPGTKITTEFEAAVFGLCALLWCALTIACLARLPRAKREQVMITSTPDRLHIARTPNWREAAEHPIDLDEWEQFAESRTDLALYDPLDARSKAEYLELTRQPGDKDPSDAAERLAAREQEVRRLDELFASRPDLVAADPGLAQALRPARRKKNFAYERGGGTRLKFHWHGSQVEVSGLGPDRVSDVALVRPIAQALGAQIMADNGTIYA